MAEYKRFVDQDNIVLRRRFKKSQV